MKVQKKVQNNWGHCIWRAQLGDASWLVELLRSDQPFPPGREHAIRHDIADLLAGRYKRKPGRQWLYFKDGKLVFPPLPDFAMDEAETYARKLKGQAQRRFKRVHGVETAAIARAARRFDVSEDALRNRLHRARPKHRRLKQRT